jgi:hypothetical protein
MQISIDDLLVRQVSAIVSATADAVCEAGDVPATETQLYEMLAEHCAEKQRLAAAAYAQSETPRLQRGLIYW